PRLYFFLALISRPPTSALFPYTTLFRSLRRSLWLSLRLGFLCWCCSWWSSLSLGFILIVKQGIGGISLGSTRHLHHFALSFLGLDRKSTRLNSSHVKISYAVFCLKKKTY